MNLVVEKILETKKISEYLDSKHIVPDGESHGKIRYLCPLHLEKTPSFFVYTQGPYEKFWCFGCKAGLNIIHLFRDLEKVSLGTAIRALSTGIEINIEAEMDSAINDIQTEESQRAGYSLGDLALMINWQLHNFLKLVENDPVCLDHYENMSKKVDQYLSCGDIESLLTINEKLTDDLLQRYKIFLEEKEKKIMSGVY